MNPAHRGKPQHRRTPLRALGVMGGALALAAVTSGTAFAQDGAPPAIKIGQLAPFTGAAAEFGEYYEDAVALAVQQLNTAAEEVFGGPIIEEHIVEDSATQPTPGIAAAQKLVNADQVPVIIGSWSSGVTTAVAESVTIDAGVLQIANGATSPLISVLPKDDDADLLFRTTAPDIYQGVVAGQLAAGEIIDDYEHESLSTIYINNPYGQGLSNALVAAFENRGGEVMAEVSHPEEVQPSYRSELSAALDGDPDLLVVVSYPGHTAVILKESRDFFEMTDWQFVDGNKSTEVEEAVGTDVLAGELGTAPGQDPEASDYQAFAETYREEMDRERIPPFTAPAYDAAMVIGLAAARAIAGGITDAEEITGEVLRDNLRPVANPPGTEVSGGTQENVTEALRLIKEGEEVAYSGADGAIDFTDAGDVVTPIEIWRFSEGGGTEALQYIPSDEIPNE